MNPWSTDFVLHTHHHLHQLSIAACASTTFRTAALDPVLWKGLWDKECKAVHKHFKGCKEEVRVISHQSA